ncbi:Sensitivity To Red Light Reduced-like, SRR1 [Beauveria brongniartii RCEF 3172]|uniref:Sensitivity To Red Light Reduced-like, SRR1 n=1 Tax=Beauveria brongniartii RCEF 3172 TaxID=1081107 RepID=A0A162JBI6_9HYPO|nr:Sensitivity To Red Light Reduced-like, SRR1 [Beauveria brongniartii RCEF 3172]
MAQPIDSRLQMLYNRVEAASCQLEEEFKDKPWILDEVAAKKQLAQNYIAAYEAGKLFFPRDMVESLDRQIDALKLAGTESGGRVTLKDVIGREGSWPLAYPSSPGECCSSKVYSIRWATHQNMTHISAKFPETMLEIDTPVSLSYSESATPCGWPLADLEAAFRTHQASWLQSAACQSLTSILTTSAAALRTPIRKIVCFGLGRLDNWEKTTREELLVSVRRSAFQHAAALTMAAALTTTTTTAAVGETVRCYAQDPAYTAEEKKLLAALGFTVLEDPKGFLEVDEATLVFSVTPNIPVRQVVADMGWPAAMVWNRIETDRQGEEGQDYTIEPTWGEDVRVS